MGALAAQNGEGIVSPELFIVFSLSFRSNIDLLYSLNFHSTFRIDIIMFLRFLAGSEADEPILRPDEN